MILAPKASRCSCTPWHSPCWGCPAPASPIPSTGLPCFAGWSYRVNTVSAALSFPKTSPGNVCLYLCLCGNYMEISKPTEEQLERL